LFSFWFHKGYASATNLLKGRRSLIASHNVLLGDLKKTTLVNMKLIFHEWAATDQPIFSSSLCDAIFSETKRFKSLY